MNRNIVGSMTSSYLHSALIITLLISQTGCGLWKLSQAAPHDEQLHAKFDKNKLYPCFKGNPVTLSGVSHPVYCLGAPGTSKPPVVLLHELPGLSAKTLEYAETLSKDFTVYIPMLFGELNQSAPRNGLFAFWFNGFFDFPFRGEWRSDLDSNTPIVVWLREVVDKISEKHADKSIGVIGNCLTGSLPLALLENKYVNAIVLAQPILPLQIFSTDDLESVGISQGVIEKAKDRLNRKENGSEFWVYGTRFEKDSLSGSNKQEYLKGQFNDHYIRAEIPASEYLLTGSSSDDERKKAHSTLIREWHLESPDGAASRRIRREVRDFLKDPKKFCASSPSCASSIR